jgi:hypothetical protein
MLVQITIQARDEDLRLCRSLWTRRKAGRDCAERLRLSVVKAPHKTHPRRRKAKPSGGADE